MHADPHAGNLLRLPPLAQPHPEGPLRRVRRLVRPWRLRGPRGAAGGDAAASMPPAVPRLAYLDFGLVSEVPLQARVVLE